MFKWFWPIFSLGAPVKFLQIAELAEADSPRIFTDINFKELRFKPALLSQE